MGITIRNAEPEDVDAVFELMRQLAGHEGMLQYFSLTSEALRRICFDHPRRVELIVAEAGNAIVGYASCLVQFSPWAARDYLFVDDVYVSDSVRGGGIGSLLMRRVGAIAIERGVDVRWHVEQDNRAAQAFYRRIGAVLREKFIAYWPLDVIRDQGS